ncbi:MAG: DUF1489 domain-containing protein [Robiginitomaculum sp.]|nr:DUF1489 domain-containing protein [Robiginitomaculum sp.]
MIKLSVGSLSVETLAAYQQGLAVRRGHEGLPAFADHITRMSPRRKAEVLDGGSIYWVIKGVIQCRNTIIDLAETHSQDGRKACRIILAPELIPVVPTPKRAFQGWRYLKPEDAPADLSSLGDAENLPPHIRTKLVELGVW